MHSNGQNDLSPPQPSAPLALFYLCRLWMVSSRRVGVHRAAGAFPATQPLIRKSFFVVAGHCRVVYLSPAANSAGPVWGRPCDVHWTVTTSQTGFTRPTSSHFPCP